MIRRSIYTCAPGTSYGQALAQGLIERVGKSPEALSRCVIFLPTKRAAPELRQAFLRVLGTGIGLLPRIHGLGEFDNDDRLGPTLGPAVAMTIKDLPSAMPPLRRQFILTQLVTRWAEQRGEEVSPALAWRLSRDLGGLVDDALSHSMDWTKLTDLVPETYAQHWQITRDFLEIVSQHWPQILSEYGRIDTRDRRDRVMRAYAEALLANPPDHPILIAGSTGTQPATRDLMRALTKLSNCAVILPGFERDLPVEDITAIKKGGAAALAHPQAQMLSTLADIGIDPAEVLDWGDTAVPADRGTFFKEAFRPAETAKAWQESRWRRDGEQALQGVKLATAASPREEASLVALAMRQALETPDKTAILITPDRALARAVAIELRSWKVNVDDSAGESASLSQTGRFLQAVADLALDPYAPIPLLNLMYHPFTRAGGSRQDFLRLTRALDLHVLRGPRPAAGRTGLIEKAKAAKHFGADDLKGLSSFIDHMAPLVQAFEQGATAKNLLISLLRTAERLASGDLAADTANTGASVLWAGDSGRALADRLGEILEAAPDNQDVTGAAFSALLKEWIAESTVRVPWPKHPRLRILSPQEARLIDADLVILGGMNEGTWPSQVEPDPWLNRDMRKALGLPDPAHAIGQSAHDVYMALHAPNVLVTRALKVEGSPTVASRWLYRLEALAGCTIERAVDLEAWAKLKITPEEVHPEAAPAPAPPVSSRPRKLSVTQIELWMRDPYSLYARKILGLVPLEPVDDSPTAAKKGTLLHDALEVFLKEDGPTRGEAGLARMIACGKDAFREVETQPAVYAFWWPRFLEIAKWFVSHEAERKDYAATVAVEAWGQLALEDVNFTVFAKADRIDAHLTDGSLEIIDYKTGMPPSAKRVEAGFAPQLPLEALIAERGGFEDLDRASVSDLVYWRLIGGVPVQEKYTPVKDVAAAIEDAEKGLKTLVRAFDCEGVPYLPNPWTGISGYGDYDHLARVGEWSARLDGLSDPNVIPLVREEGE